MLNRLSPERKAAYLRTKSEKAKKLNLAAGLLIFSVMGESEVKTPAGKPYIAGALCFSVSHSDDIALLAVSGSQIGADIEKRRHVNISALAKRAFHPEEQESLAAAADRERAFFRIWTMKESLKKMTGEGIYDPAGFSVFSESGARFFTSDDMINGYTVSVCSADADVPKKIEFLDI